MCWKGKSFWEVVAELHSQKPVVPNGSSGPMFLTIATPTVLTPNGCVGIYASVVPYTAPPVVGVLPIQRVDGPAVLAARAFVDPRVELAVGEIEWKEMSNERGEAIPFGVDQATKQVVPRLPADAGRFLSAKGVLTGRLVSRYRYVDVDEPAGKKIDLAEGKLTIERFRVTENDVDLQLSLRPNEEWGKGPFANRALVVEVRNRKGATVGRVEASVFKHVHLVVDDTQGPFGIRLRQAERISDVRIPVEVKDVPISGGG